MSDTTSKPLPCGLADPASTHHNASSPSINEHTSLCKNPSFRTTERMDLLRDSSPDNEVDVSSHLLGIFHMDNESTPLATSPPVPESCRDTTAGRVVSALQLRTATCDPLVGPLPSRRRHTIHQHTPEMQRVRDGHHQATHSIGGQANSLVKSKSTPIKIENPKTIKNSKNTKTIKNSQKPKTIKKEEKHKKISAEDFKLHPVSSTDDDVSFKPLYIPKIDLPKVIDESNFEEVQNYCNGIVESANTQISLVKDPETIDMLKLWRKIHLKTKTIAQAVSGLQQLAIKIKNINIHKERAELNLSDNIDEFMLYHSWSAQSFSRQRTRSDDPGDKAHLIGEPPAPFEIDDPAYDECDEILKNIHDAINDLTKITPKICDVDAKANIRMILYEFYERVNSTLSTKAIYSVGALDRFNWYDSQPVSPQSGKKVQQELSQLLSSVKIPSHSTCYNRLGNTSASRPTSSFGPAASGKQLTQMKETLEEFKAQAYGLPVNTTMQFDDKAQKALDNIVDIGKSLSTDGLTFKMDFFGPMRDAIFKFFHGITEIPYAKDISIGVIAAFVTYKAVKTKSAVWTFICTAISILAVSQITVTDGADFLNRILSFRSCETVEELNLERDDELIHAQDAKESMMDSLLAYVHVTSFFKSYKSDDPVGTFFKESGHLKRNTEGVGFSLDWMISIVQKFLNWVCDKLGTPRVVLRDQPYPEVYEFAEKADKMCTEFNAGAEYNAINGKKYYDLVSEGNQAISKIPNNTKEGQEAQRLILIALASMRGIGDKLSRSNIVGNGPRSVPTPIMIAGPTGIGKSYATTFITNDILARTLPVEKLNDFAENSNDFTYFRNSETNFYSGYHGQPCVVLDDIGQVKDIAGTPQNGYMEVIRMIGTNNYTLDMAHLGDKGNVNFRSDLIVASTNRTLFQLDSLYYNEAFCRRWELSYIMVPKKEYCKEETYSSVVTSESLWKRRIDHFPAEKDDMSHLEFFPYDTLTGQLTGHKALNYDNFVDKCVSFHEARQSHGGAMLSAHQKKKMATIAARNIVIKAQSGSTASDDYHDSLETIRGPPELDLSVAAIEPIPNSKSSKAAIESVAVESQLNVDFIRKYIDECAKDSVDRAILIANLKIKSMEVINSEELSDSQLSLVRRSCREYMGKFSDILSEGIKVAMKHKKVIASIVVALGTLKVVISNLQTLVPGAESSSRASGRGARTYVPTLRKSKGADKYTTYNLKHKQSGRGHVQLRGAKYDAQSADGATNSILAKLYRKVMYRIRIEGGKWMGLVTVVTPYTLLMPLHFGERIAYDLQCGIIFSDDFIELENLMSPGPTIKIRLDSFNILSTERGDRNDWCIVRVPKVIPRTINTLQYWADETDSIDRGQFTIATSVIRNDHLHTYSAPAVPRKEALYEQYELTRAWEYSIETQEGDCGALLAQVNPCSKGKKLIGIHTAGYRGTRGLGPSIYRHELEEAIALADKEFGGETFDIADEEIEEQEELEPDLIEGFESQCAGRKFRTPTDTNIRKSPLHNTYCVSKMKPAKLRAGYIKSVSDDGEITETLVHPMDKARAKYTGDVVSMEPTILKLTADYLLGHMSKNSINTAPWKKPKVFTFEEAIAGESGVPFMEGIPRNTSPGYPYNIDIPPGAKGKSHFFGKDGDYEFTSDYCKKLKERVEHVVQLAKKRKRGLHVFMDFLKDERRPIAKADAYKTRMVSACPLDLLVVHRMYFLDFVRWMMENRISNGSAVGANAYSDEWHKLATHLMSTRKMSAADINFIKCMIAGDYAGYDGSITRQIQMTVLRIINVWYSDGNDEIREVLWEEICNSRHIWDGIIYAWNGRNPSGCFVTTILNTLVGMLLIGYTYVVAYLKEKHPNLDQDSELYTKCIFEALKSWVNNVAWSCYGDDNIMSVSENASAYFSQDTMTEILASIGYTYTNESKDDSITLPHRPLGSVSFLKRGFHVNPRSGLIVCPLDINTVLEMPQWTIKTDRSWQFVKINVENSLKELSLHGAEAFQHWAPKIISAAQEHLNFIPSMTDFETLRATTLALEYLL